MIDGSNFKIAIAASSQVANVHFNSFVNMHSDDGWSLTRE